MPYQDTLHQVEMLRAAIEAHAPLSAAVLKKVNYKFRLEWNYTSNSMEGNSLTRSETRSVMIGNVTVNSKPIKDVLEMKGHDEIISSILKIGAGEAQLSEARIREIHRGIMHEEDPEKNAFIGKWKTGDNFLTNYKGERIDFTPHAEVPETMHQLMNWLSAQREKISRVEADAMHPALLAFEFHLRYVTIHPFYDGNGRTARILTNLLLIAYGYPPVWVAEQERTPYYQYLADIQAYGGSPDVFYDFMLGLLTRSQQIMLDAAEGREIEEPNDLDKKIALLKTQLGVSKKDLTGLTYTSALVASVIQESGFAFAAAWEKRLESFDPLFERRLVYISATGQNFMDGPWQHTKREAPIALEEFYANTLSSLLAQDQPIRDLSFECLFGNLVTITDKFQLSGSKLFFRFKQNNYDVTLQDGNRQAIIKLTKFYDEQLSKEEIDELVIEMGNRLYNLIQDCIIRDEGEQQ